MRRRVRGRTEGHDDVACAIDKAAAVTVAEALLRGALPRVSSVLDRRCSGM